jgi:alkylated DNA repair protein alkB homolog 8
MTAWIIRARATGVFRFAIWPEVRRFIEGLPAGAVVADVGCGNGKYFALRRDVAVLGSDRSAGLTAVAMRAARHAQARGGNCAADAVTADGMALPYRPGSMDAVLCIAVLHHVSSAARRLRFLRALRDLLRPGGRAIVTAWATRQENPAKTVDRWSPVDVFSERGGDAERADSSAGIASEARQEHAAELPPADVGPVSRTADQGATQAASDYFVPWHVPFHRAGQHLSQLRPEERAEPNIVATSRIAVPPDSQADALGQAHDAHPGPGTAGTATVGAAVGEINDEKRTVVFKRYYHLFAEGELDALATDVPGVRVCYSLYDASNWVIVFERIAG